jgi:chromosome segregation ATPase
MIETILSIKICLFLVFITGLLTGYFYIRRLIKEDYLPIIKKYQNSIKENNKIISKYKADIVKSNEEIGTLRDNIKSYKNESKVIDEDLLNIEHDYSKQSDITKQKELKILEYEKILNSLKKEYDFLNEKVLNKENIINNNKTSKEEMANIENLIENKNHDIAELNNEIKKHHESVKELKKEINVKKLNLTRLSHEFEELEKSIENNPKLATALEIDKLNNKLQEYKEKLKNAN